MESSIRSKRSSTGRPKSESDWSEPECEWPGPVGRFGLMSKAAFSVERESWSMRRAMCAEEL